METKNIIFIVLLSILIVGTILFSVIPKELLLCSDNTSDDKFYCNNYFYGGFSILGAILIIILIILISKLIKNKVSNAIYGLIIFFLVLLILGQTSLTLLFNIPDLFNSIINTIKNWFTETSNNTRKIRLNSA